MLKKSFLLSSFILLVLVLFFSNKAHAEKFELKNGKEIEGTILTQDKTSFMVETATGIVQINRSELMGAESGKEVVVHERISSTQQATGTSLEGLQVFKKRGLQENKVTIWGVVTDSQGKPLKDIVIERRTNGKWHYAGYAVDDGSYKLEFSKLNGKIASPVEALRAVWKAGGKEEISEGPWTQNAEVSFVFSDEESFKISGRVLTPKGKPAVKAHVTLKDLDDKSMATWTTDKDGEFEFKVAKTIKAIFVYYSSDEGQNVKDFSGPWKADAYVELKLKPIDKSKVKLGTTFEVGEEYGEMIIREP